MKTKISISTSFSLIFFTATLFSWMPISGQNENIRLMYHDNWKTKLHKKPKDIRRWQDFELFSKMYSRIAVPEEKTLALVFNVIDIGALGKINAQIIEEQLTTLNQAFKGELMNNSGRSYSQLIAGDTKIKFCLGDPPGNVDGINFKSRPLAYDFSTFELISDKKDGLEGAKKDEYINVWITEIPDDMAGIAIMPDQDSVADGIYIDPDFFGKKPNSVKYGEGITIVHLIGQYLGLKPLWGDGQCSDDGIEDTPIHNGPNYECFPFSHVSLCAGNHEELIGNFMDANPDQCSFMFTKGQAGRMHATLSDRGYRKKLLDAITLCSGNAKNESISQNRNTQENNPLDFNIVPNPSSNYIAVNFYNSYKESQITVSILDLSGRIIYKNEIQPFGEHRGAIKIDVSRFENGTYVVKLNNEFELISKTFIKL